MLGLQQRLADIVMADPAVAGIGSSLGGSTARGGSNRGFMYITLKSPEERHGLTTQQVIDRLRRELGKVAGIRLFMFAAQDVRAGGRQSDSNYQYTLTSADLAYPVTELLFKADAGPLDLYYGNREAAAPRYDIALIAGQILAADKETATLGPEETGSGESWAGRALKGTRSGVVFWAALGLVVVALLVVVAKLLPKPPATGA